LKPKLRNLEKPPEQRGDYYRHLSEKINNNFNQLSEQIKTACSVRSAPLLAFPLRAGVNSTDLISAVNSFIDKK